MSPTEKKRGGTKGLLVPEVIAKISGFELKVGSVVEGVLSGIHKSPHRGQSVEFAEHKEYSPGDDINTIDWRVFARFDRYFVKEFEAETNLRAYLAVDTSSSMGFGSGPMTKLEYAALLSASLAYLLLKQGDAVGLAPFTTNVRSAVACRTGGGHMNSVLAALESLKARGSTSLSDLFVQVFELAKRRSLVIVFSDLLDATPDWLDALGGLKSRGHGLIAIQVLDRAELDFPYFGPRMFEDPEGGVSVMADADVIKRRYLKEIDGYIASVAARCRELGAGHLLAVTDTPPAQVLLDLLSRHSGSAGTNPAGRGRGVG